jgi:tetratricopeptide (TPR) repeat protein
MARDSLVEALFRSRREEEATQQVEYFRGAWPEDYRAELLEGRRRAYLYLHRQSRQFFEAALVRNPSAAEAIVGIARAQIATSDFDGAEKSLRRALAVGGPRADAWGTFALLELSGRGSVQRARRFSERALALDPGEPVAHHVIGDLYLREDDLMSMMYHYRLALLRNPHNTPINRFLIRSQFSAEDLIAEENLQAPPPRK